MPVEYRADYAVLDRPEVLSLLFHPRKDWGVSDRGAPSRDIFIPVEEGVAVGARFHMADKTAPNILFFHGNGEIVSDYDDLGPVYNRMGINFLPVDYRGYGQSSGTPTVTGMMKDCHVIFRFVKKWLKDNACSGPFIVMGRSLGSASVLELSASYGKEIDALIVESGFAYAGPLLQLLGVDTRTLGFREEEGFRNVDKIREFVGPLLIIHAERDHIIPFSDAEAIYEASGSPDKTLLKIPKANHNDIFALGFTEYMKAVKELADKLNPH